MARIGADRRQQQPLPLLPADLIVQRKRQFHGFAMRLAPASLIGLRFQNCVGRDPWERHLPGHRAVAPTRISEIAIPDPATARSLVAEALGSEREIALTKSLEARKTLRR